MVFKRPKAAVVLSLLTVYLILLTGITSSAPTPYGAVPICHPHIGRERSPIRRKNLEESRSSAPRPSVGAECSGVDRSNFVVAGKLVAVEDRLAVEDKRKLAEDKRKLAGDRHRRVAVEDRRIQEADTRDAQ